MGVYNGQEGLKRSIDSILNQTYEDFEFIICDDASTDKSGEILKEYAKKDKRIRVLTNQTNKKLAATLNYCIQEAAGEYIARMDDDDRAFKKRFEKQVAFLDAHPEYALVGTGVKRFDKQGVWGETFCVRQPSLKQCFQNVQFVHPSVMMRSAALKEVGGYTEDKENYRSQDYDLWCKLYQKGYQGYNLQEPLLYYCESPESITRRKKRHRIDFFKKQMRWRKRLKLPGWYDVYAWIGLCKILIPNRVLLYIRKRR